VAAPTPTATTASSKRVARQAYFWVVAWGFFCEFIFSLAGSTRGFYYTLIEVKNKRFIISTLLYSCFICTRIFQLQACLKASSPKHTRQTKHVLTRIWMSSSLVSFCILLCRMQVGRCVAVMSTFVSLYVCVSLSVYISFLSLLISLSYPMSPYLSFLADLLILSLKSPCSLVGFVAKSFPQAETDAFWIWTPCHEKLNLTSGIGRQRKTQKR
jgi:hypothetical protein